MFIRHKVRLFPITYSVSPYVFHHQERYRRCKLALAIAQLLQARHRIPQSKYVHRRSFIETIEFPGLNSLPYLNTHY